MTKKEHYLVREAREDTDETTLAYLFSECFEPITQRRVRQIMQRAKSDSDGWSRSFVAEAAGKVISNVSVELKKLHFGEGIYLKSGGIAGVCTCSAFRRKGFATNLFQLCMEYVRNSEISNCSLYTGTKLPAHQIYKRKGFRDIERLSAFVKFLDFNHYFRSWLRDLNRYIKSSRIAQKALQGWNRSVVFRLENNVQCFRFKRGHFQRLPKPLRSMDIEIETTIRTLIQVMWHSTDMKNAILTGKVRVEKGTESDLKTLEKILTGIWDE